MKQFSYLINENNLVPLLVSLLRINECAVLCFRNPAKSIVARILAWRRRRFPSQFRTFCILNSCRMGCALSSVTHPKVTLPEAVTSSSDILNRPDADLFRVFPDCQQSIWDLPEPAVEDQKVGKHRRVSPQAKDVCEIFGKYFMNSTHILHGVKKESPTLKRQPFNPIFRSPIPAFEI